MDKQSLEGRRSQRNHGYMLGCGMICVTMNLTSDEWVKIRQCAEKQFPKENLSHAEICRRYVLAGIGALKNRSPAEIDRIAHELQCSQQAPDEPPTA